VDPRSYLTSSYSLLYNSASSINQSIITASIVPSLANIPEGQNESNNQNECDNQNDNDNISISSSIESTSMSL